MKIRTFAVLLVLCLAALSVAASEQRGAAAPVPETGQQVAVDPNGQLRPPTPEEQAALNAPVSDRVLKVKTTATGALSIALDETFDHMFVATTDEEGHLLFTCTDDHSAAAAMLKASPADTILRLRPRASARPVAERE